MSMFGKYSRTAVCGLSSDVYKNVKRKNKTLLVWNGYERKINYDWPNVKEKIVYGKQRNTLKFKMASTGKKYSS